METWNEIDEWVDRYVRGDLSGEDRAALMKWLEASPEHAKQFRKMLQAEMRVSAVGKWQRLDQTRERVWERITPALVDRKRRLYLWGMRVAAIVLILVGVSFLWQLRKEPVKNLETVASLMQVESGSPRAILKFDNGEQIELRDGETKNIALVSGVKVMQDSLGGVKFEDKSIGREEAVTYNTIVVPEKGEYFVVLSDDTKVWMNSGSELSFPTRFGENEREVKLKGEAYFEVEANPRKPFYVCMGRAKVRVLGTAFNVMAYQDDRQMEVALLHGKVSFDISQKEYLLVPGEIATCNRLTGETSIRKGNVNAIVDWKSGRFTFEDMSLEDLVVKLRRWYGVEFEFKDERAKQLRFSGAVTRYRNLDYILNMISKTTEVEFLEGNNKVVVRIKDRK